MNQTPSFARMLSLTAVLALGCSEALDDAIGGGEPSFTRIFESDEFQECAGCHAPDAQSDVEGTEQTQNWSTRDAAYASLQGTASGLIGNFEGCNGVPFLGASAERSLLVAAFDADVRSGYENPSFPDCTGDAISDQTLKIGGDLPSALLQELKDWVDAGAPNN